MHRTKRGKRKEGGRGKGVKGKFANPLLLVLVDKGRGVNGRNLEGKKEKKKRGGTEGMQVRLLYSSSV